jgi:release factor glutamine methyltransferase
MEVKIHTIRDIKIYLTRELESIYPESEIWAFTSIIIKTVLKTSGLHAFAMPETVVSRQHINEIIMICSELKSGKPLQYILGETGFYNCRIKVTADTLIPRPETEELVDIIVKENRDFRGSILDIGTGSGCIAIALAVNLPGTKVSGTDISEGALKIAEENAKLNNVTVIFEKSDIFKPGTWLFGNQDIIVSNPPYIRESEKRLIAGNVLDFEPHSALFVPDQSPLIYYQAILELAGRILIRGGKVYFEINEAMGKEMSELLKYFQFRDIRLLKDINGRDRIIMGISNG